MTAGPSVVLVDDHPVFRRGLAGLLLEDGAVVLGEAGTAAEGVRLAQHLRPDVVVMDLHLPDRSGVEAIRELVAADPDVRVLVLTMDAADATVIAVLRAGARGHLLKEAAAESIGQAVRTSAAGGTVLDPRLAARLPTLLRDAAPGSIPGLSPREQQVAALVAEGRTNTEIARRLFLADKTVRNLVSSVLAKSGAADRGALAALLGPEQR